MITGSTLDAKEWAQMVTTGHKIEIIYEKRNQNSPKKSRSSLFDMNE